ncbi:MAG: histidinol-phosphatase [Firmicutes bacterium]|jgi:histidinol-phosphatase (PHP family)|nr:histidinol-phosphatase [Bacillota bacterium]
MIDYHIHLENGPYTLEWLEEFWRQAQKQGIREIGITEHCHKFSEFYPMFAPLTEGEGSYQYMRDWITQDFQHDLAQYIELLLNARSAGIPVKIGLELDYLSGMESVARRIIDQYPFDFILGSVHVIGKWGFDFAPDVWEGRDVNQAYLDYYATLDQAVDSGLFDIAAHFDLIKVWGQRPDHTLIPALEALVEGILAKVAANQLSLELSSAGWRKPVGEQYPACIIIQRAADMQIPVTFASDAHYPWDVGADWKRLTEIAGRYGYQEYSVYTNRQRISVPL